MRSAEILTIAATLLALAATPAAAQQKKDAKKPAAKPGSVEISLKFEREVFSYPGQGRRDPFKPLTGAAGAGPRFEEISLQGTIYSPDPARSVALLADGTGKIYRVRRGDRVGNTRVVNVESRRVIVSVESFGRARQEILELKRRGVDEVAPAEDTTRVEDTTQ